jgi:hypothetical protein
MTAIHFRAIKQHPIILKKRLTLKKCPAPTDVGCTSTGLALAITHGAANRPPQIALISIETGYRNGAIRTERHKHCF